MKTKTQVLKTKSGKIVATAYPWDSQGNRDWQKRHQEKQTGEKLEWKDGPDADIINP